MQAVQQQLSGHHLLYDADSVNDITLQWFDAHYWRTEQTLFGTAQGRGSTVFFQHQGQIYALRHYYRGGAIARLLQDRYVWHGVEQSRAWREWRLLALLHQRGLPVPAPVAAHLHRSGVCYTADLITLKLPDSQTLAQQLAVARLDDTVWQRIGAVLRQFHAAGVDHADLNAHNIVFSGERIYLLDFDRGRLRTSHGPFARYWQNANLQRLQRSLYKIAVPKTHFSNTQWEELVTGYESEDRRLRTED